MELCVETVGKNHQDVCRLVPGQLPGYEQKTCYGFLAAIFCAVKKLFFPCLIVPESEMKYSRSFPSLISELEASCHRETELSEVSFGFLFNKVKEVSAKKTQFMFDCHRKYLFGEINKLKDLGKSDEDIILELAAGNRPDLYKFEDFSLGPIVSCERFLMLIDDWLKKDREEKRIWLVDGPPKYQNSLALIQKLELKEKDELLLSADEHGDVKSFLVKLKKMGLVNEAIKTFKLEAENKKLFFLGDIGDRGFDSCTIWYIVLRLLLENPGKVFLVRGNHEEDRTALRYGLFAELGLRYPEKQVELFNKLRQVWYRLPSIIFASCSVGKMYAFCHGGLFIDYDSRKLSLSAGKSLWDWVDFGGDTCNKRCMEVRKNLWNDLCEYAKKKKFKFNGCYSLDSKNDLIRWLDYKKDTGFKEDISSRFAITKKVSDLVLELLGIEGVFRGHQQTDFISQLFSGDGVAALGRTNYGKFTSHDVVTIMMSPTGYLSSSLKWPEKFTGYATVTVKSEEPWCCTGTRIAFEDIHSLK